MMTTCSTVVTMEFQNQLGCNSIPSGSPCTDVRYFQYYPSYHRSFPLQVLEEDPKVCQRQNDLTSSSAACPPLCQCPQSEERACSGISRIANAKQDSLQEELCRKECAAERWKRWAGIFLISSMLGHESDGDELAKCVSKIAGNDFSHCIAALHNLLSLRGSETSGTWTMRRFKIATCSTLSKMHHIRIGTQRHNQLAAFAFAACLAWDPGVEFHSLPLRPDARCFITLARCGRLKCADVGGQDVVLNLLKRWIRHGRPKSVQNALALLEHFQLSTADVEQELRTLVTNTLEVLANTETLEEVARRGEDKIERHPQILLGLLKREVVSWWALPVDVIRQAGCNAVWGVSRADFEAWAGVSQLSREEVLAGIECPKPKLSPLKILAGVRHWHVTSDDLSADCKTAMAYVQKLLQKPRTGFLSAVEFFVHFGLANHCKFLQQFETEALKALAVLVKSDRQVLEDALRALLREPSLRKPPCDWVAAVDGLERGDRGPSSWPSWNATMAPKAPLVELILNVPLHVVVDPSDLQTSVDAILASGRVAIDAEWTRDSPDAAIVQLGIDSRVFVWDLQLLPRDEASAAMQKIFGNPRIRKLGFGFSHSDWPHLSQWVADARRIVDVDRLWLHLHPDEPLLGLKRLVSKVLGCQMDKSQQCSNWAARPLSQQQLEYAALDAHALLQVWDVMSPPESAVDAVSLDLSRSFTAAEGRHRIQTPEKLQDLQALDLRVGMVLSSSPVPGTRHLSVCSVDIGSLGRRQVVQGCPVQPGQRVLVLCNIAPAEIHNIWSQGGLLVAYFEDGRRIPAAPPVSAAVGTAVLTSAGTVPPIDVTVPDNAWCKCRERLTIAANENLDFDGTVLEIDGMPCKVPGGHGGMFR
eukprot:gnl/MRDRNA2_/MRDRNA2_72298_c0_seq2.p1 gnl/MRDRNA2_/MRDRNA2_72298_c0~~gnl/MRDRNA2_/MRDRNA2_72298_c0_seq2.p1  ORF type:complete len:872 (+),score=111.26 gnl/MRDRNA2_/MRDRNA2_72298_c0_seq2:59-2674(+)